MPRKTPAELFGPPRNDLVPRWPEERRCQDRVAIYDDDGRKKMGPDGKPLTRQCCNPQMGSLDRCWMHARRASGEPTREKPRFPDPERWLKKHTRRVGNLLADMDLQDMHPMDGLLLAVRQSGTMAQALGMLVAELPEAPELDADGGVIMPGMWGANHAGDQMPHVLVTLYGMWHDRHAKACQMALSAGIDERLVRNAEFTSAALFEAFRKALAAVNLTPEQKQELSRVLAKEVRSVVARPEVTNTG